MRYLAGFIGGLIVGALLFVLQRHLIEVDESVKKSPPTVITLTQIPVSQPPENKPYEPKEPPPEPEATTAKPVDPIVKVDTTTPRPTLDSISGVVVAEGKTSVDIWSDDSVTGMLDGTAVILVQVAPQYPVTAAQKGIEGVVEVEFTILADGSVSDVEIIRANPSGVFEQSARQAVLRWQFQPRMEDGRPVTMRARQLIEFNLQQE